MGAQIWRDGENGKHERDRERLHLATGSLVKPQQLRVERMAFALPIATTQLEEATGRDGRHAIKGEVGTIEPTVDESGIVNAHSSLIDAKKERE